MRKLGNEMPELLKVRADTGSDARNRISPDLKFRLIVSRTISGAFYCLNIQSFVVAYIK